MGLGGVEEPAEPLPPVLPHEEPQELEEPDEVEEGLGPVAVAQSVAVRGRPGRSPTGRRGRRKGETAGGRTGAPREAVR